MGFLFLFVYLTKQNKIKLGFKTGKGQLCRPKSVKVYGSMGEGVCVWGGITFQVPLLLISSC